MSKGSTNWAKYVADQADSQLSMSDYCKQHGVNPKRLYFWRHKLQTRIQAPALIPVTVTGNSQVTSLYCTVEYPHGVRLRIESQEALALLPQLLKERS